MSQDPKVGSSAQAVTVKLPYPVAVGTYDTLLCVNHRKLYGPPPVSPPTAEWPPPDPPPPVPQGPELKCDVILWPVFVWINAASTAQIEVDVVGPPPGDAQFVVYKNVQSGNWTGIPVSVGQTTYQLKADPSKYACIPVVLLWEQYENTGTPANAAQAGYRAFTATLKSAIAAQAGVLFFTENDPTSQQSIINGIKDQVKSAVHDAISNNLTTRQKIDIALGYDPADYEVADGEVVVSNLTARGRSFTLNLVNPDFDTFGLSGNIAFSTPQLSVRPATR